MSQPLEAPRRRPTERPRSWWVWIALVSLVVMLPLALFGGYRLGQRFSGVEIWDSVWLRAYQNRPLDTAAPKDGFWVAGYYVDYDRTSFQVVKTRSSHMDQVVIFGYGFDAQGNVVGSDQELIRGVTGPQKRVLLFANLTDGAFNRETGRALLTNPEVRERALQGIVAKAEELGVAGVQIDFEDIAPANRAAYTEFMRLLKERLQPKGLTLSVAVPGKTHDDRTGWGGAMDYPALGQIVDYLYIMAYDEHWRGGPPGPVASLGWVEKVVRYATGVMPAQKILLGVPFYGYEWSAEPGGGTKTNRAYGSDRMAERAAQFGAKVQWDPVHGENVATFKTQEGERIAWFPDQRSLDAKLLMAYQYNLKGVALWRVGFEPDDWWNKMGGFRLSPTK